MKHGTRYAYQKKDCRCDACSAWQTARMRRYWARRGNRPSNWASFNGIRPTQPWRGRI